MSLVNNSFSHQSVFSVGNVIFFFGDVSDHSVANLLQQTAYACNYSVDNKLPEVELRITSYGGIISAGIACYYGLHKITSMANIGLRTVVDGHCCSAATLLLLSGSIRLGGKYSRFQIHNALTALSEGEVSQHDVNMMFRTHESINNSVAEFYTDHLGKTPDFWREIMNKDENICAETAKKIGLIDGIIHLALPAPPSGRKSLKKGQVAKS